MNGWIKLAAFVAVAAIVGGLSGGAGATSSPAGATKAGSTAAHRAASSRAALLRRANLETAAGVKRYLRAIGVNPKGVVIQRGARNYAGPSCPGAGWACTSTAHTVVQIARAGGKNSFFCTSGSCVVVQTAKASRAARALAAAAFTQNIARCIKTTGVTQNCSIIQNDLNADNTAVVYMNTSKMSGLTQTASYTASITQTGHTNKACVLQNINMDGSTVALRGKPVTVTLRAHQSITIAQDSPAGSTASNSANSSGGCDPGPLTQTQTLTSTAYGTGNITQLENDPADPTPGPNLNLVINQNQSPGFRAPNPTHGLNTMDFLQQSNQVAMASGGQAPNSIPDTATVTQTQSKPNAGDAGGGIAATVNQFSKDKSTINAKQVENQCLAGKKSGSLPTGGPLPTDPNGCFTFDRSGNTLPANLNQTQFGPIGTDGGPKRSKARRSLQPKKGPGPSVQGDHSQDTFTVKQTTTQLDDAGHDLNQKNLVQGDCVTSGTCNADQNATVNNILLTQPTQSGQNVSTSIVCTGSSCPATPIIDSGPTPQPGGTTGSTSATFTFHDAFAAATFLCSLDGSGFSPCLSGVTYNNLACASSHTFSVEATNQAQDVTLPATFGWRIPICAPTIDSSPSNPSSSTSATFTFHADHTTDAQPGFLCQVDGVGDYQACSSPDAFTVTCGSSHTFSVETTDQYGDVTAPTTFSWTVPICFDGTPGTGTPPPTLGPYTMTAFGTDSQPLGDVSGVTDPAGTISFSPDLHHDTVPNGGFNNWSNGYTGDVYDSCFQGDTGCTATDTSHARITLPAGTNAFYFYAEQNTFGNFTLQATAQNGTTSGPVEVATPGGAKYFGFYGTGGVTLAYIDVTVDDPLGFAVGEFGINTTSP